MEFEFDPAKSASNKTKHGLDFVEAQALWSDPELVVLPSQDEKEPRHLAVGFLKGRHWTSIVTLRGDVVRLISVRRAREKEVECYEKNKSD